MPMTLNKFSKNFRLYEILPPELYGRYFSAGLIEIGLYSTGEKPFRIAEKRICSRLIREYSKIAETAEAVRKLAGKPCLCNNWHREKRFLSLFAGRLNEDFSELMFLRKLRRMTMLYGKERFCFRGLRPFACAVGAAASGHKFPSTGTIDLSFNGSEAEYEEVRRKLFETGKFIVEVGNTGWIHASQPDKGEKPYLFTPDNKVYRSWEEYKKNV